MTDKNNTGEIKVTEYIEHKDGSATIIFDADVKARDLLVKAGYPNASSGSSYK